MATNYERDRKISFYLKAINDEMRRRFNNDLEPYDLTASQLYFLIQLGFHHGQMRLKEMQQAMHVSQPTVAGISARLVNKNLISLERDPEDARVKYAILTEKGRQHAELFRDKGIKAGHQMLEGLTETEKEILFTLLKKVFESVKGE